MHKTSDLKMKDVVNVLDGKRLGAVTDIELDIETGKLTAIVIQQKRGVFRLSGRYQDIVIPWDRITKIGDCVLVEASASTVVQDLIVKQKDKSHLVLGPTLQQEFPGSENDQLP